MNHQNFAWDKFYEVPIIGILRNTDFKYLPCILKSFTEAGLSTIEITFNSVSFREQMMYALNEFGCHINIGIGTIRNLEELEIALRSGVGFIVTPNVDIQVIARCKEVGIPVFTGAFSPTEIYKAKTAGADMVKLFPASVMGPEYIKSLKGPLDHIPLIPTGGVDIENMLDFLSAGASGLGIGGTLFARELIENNEWLKLKLHMKEYVERISTRN